MASKNTARLNVWLQFDLVEEAISVGELVLDNRLIHFKYAATFLEKSIDLSPLRLPKSNQIYTGDPRLFGGLAGLFYDSLPDSWGKLLLDRKLISSGINSAQINALDRLAYVGNKGPGALIYKPTFDSEFKTSDDLKLDDLANESSAIVQGADSEIIDELYALGGSSGGARPKIEVQFNPINQELVFGKASNPEFEHWLIKFPSSFDEPDIANIEFAYYSMAKEAGIEMMESRLFQGASGKVYFGTKRFDKVGTKRIHTHSAAGLIHDDFRYSQMDYGHLMDAGFRLTRHINTYERILRLAAFNLYTHNRDDHSKNFAFLMDQKGEWKFAPAFDLTFSTSSQGHHSTMFAGESLNPTKAHLQELASSFGLKSINHIIDEVKSVSSRWIYFADKAGVSERSKINIESSLNRLLNV